MNRFSRDIDEFGMQASLPAQTKGRAEKGRKDHRSFAETYTEEKG
jgi:hypothetical protein